MENVTFNQIRLTLNSIGRCIENGYWDCYESDLRRLSKQVDQFRKGRRERIIDEGLRALNALQNQRQLTCKPISLKGLRACVPPMSVNASAFFCEHGGERTMRVTSDIWGGETE
jgi:hypothetical protein